MLVCKIKKWGNSLGLLIPRQEAIGLDLRAHQEVVVEIIKKENPLGELFGFGKKQPITKKAVREMRSLLEPRV